MKFTEFKDAVDKSVQRSPESEGRSSKARHLESILEIVKKINRSLILEEVLQLVLKHALSIAEAERGFIVLQNSNGKLDFKLGLDSEGNNLDESTFTVSTTVVENVFKTGHAKFIEGAQSDTKHDPSKSILKLELQTILCAPLITGNKKIGVLYLDSKHLRKINVSEITDTFEILAGEAAAAIRNAQTYKLQIKAYKALREANAQLVKAMEETEKSDRLKSQFLAQMSHEIRTPLNTVLNFISLLKEDTIDIVPDEHKDTFDLITTAGNRLIRTVELILETAQIQTGNYSTNPVSINLEKDVLEYLITESAQSVKNKNLELTFENKIKDVTIRADRYMVTQILSNLIDNAIKYTNEGSIAIILYKNADDKICVDVKDTGIGISESYLDELFTPFSQEEMGYTRKFEGNGLGLSLSQKFAELNNADILVKSQKGKGSTFTVIFD